MVLLSTNSSELEGGGGNKEQVSLESSAALEGENSFIEDKKENGPSDSEF